MNIKKYLLIILSFQLFTSSSFSQDLPLCFSWNKVKTSSCGEELNFVENPQEQLFQGPCLSYALISTIQTVYNIESNTTKAVSDLVLSVPYLDVNVSSSISLEDVYRSTLRNRNFKIAAQKSSNYSEVTRFSEYLPGINSLTHTSYTGFKNGASNCVEEEKHFKITNNGDEFSPNWVIDTSCDSEQIVSYMSLQDLEKFQPSSISALKKRIIDYGPLVMKVSEEILNNFKEYSTYRENLDYHAYSIIGWENDGTANTKWILSDSWIGASGIITSNSINNNTFIQYLNNNKIELHEVRGVELNGGSLSNTNRANVDYSVQCESELGNVVLSEIFKTPGEYTIGNMMYSYFQVFSDMSVIEWEWQFYSGLSRSQLDYPKTSSIMLSPRFNGYVTVKVRAQGCSGDWTGWKQKTFYLSNGNAGPE